MKYTKLVLLLSILLAVACYFLGKQQGGNVIQQQVVNNIQLVKEIAALATLKVEGNTTVKISNFNNQTNDWLTSVKKYFSENTLQITIPYSAIYGVKIDSQQINISSSNKTIEINLPKASLMSVQLQLDKLSTMNQTGIFRSTSLDNFATAQKQLYDEVQNSLQNNAAYIQQSQEGVRKIIQQYYQPLGYTVNINFKN
ncbi:MAG: DUF4230 domain-containing protein [Chitinophagaceae bacterium]